MGFGTVPLQLHAAPFILPRKILVVLAYLCNSEPPKWFTDTKTRNTDGSPHNPKSLSIGDLEFSGELPWIGMRRWSGLSKNKKKKQKGTHPTSLGEWQLHIFCHGDYFHGNWVPWQRHTVIMCLRAQHRCACVRGKQDQHGFWTCWIPVRKKKQEPSLISDYSVSGMKIAAAGRTLKAGGKSKERYLDGKLTNLSTKDSNAKEYYLMNVIFWFRSHSYGLRPLCRSYLRIRH